MNMYEKALQKIKEGEKCKPNFCCCSIVGKPIHNRIFIKYFNCDRSSSFTYEYI